MATLDRALVEAIKVTVSTNPTGPVAGRVFVDDGRDLASVTLPYVTLLLPVPDNPSLMGDGAPMARRTRVQSDLWQHIDSYDPDLPETLRDLLDGHTLTGFEDDTLDYPRTVRCRVISLGIGPLTEEDRRDGIVRHTLELMVDHLVAA